MGIRLLLVPVVLLVTSCQGAGSGGLSVADRATTAQVCVQAGGAIKDATGVGVQLAARPEFRRC